jgi:hypothetical protein
MPLFCPHIRAAGGGKRQIHIEAQGVPGWRRTVRAVDTNGPQIDSKGCPHDQPRPALGPDFRFQFRAFFRGRSTASLFSKIGSLQ